MTHYRDTSRVVLMILVGLLDCINAESVSPAWRSTNLHMVGGNKPDRCPKCKKPIYEVATFQARASYVGSAFQYACMHLLKESFNIRVKPTFDITPLYDFEIKRNVVVEAKGSPQYIINPDGSKSKLGRAGMTRTDTKKKAFSNATEWLFLHNYKRPTKKSNSV